MIASHLAATLFELSTESDMSAVTRNDIMERFESLRSYGRLPRGRERRNQELTNSEIAAAILGLASQNPKWAGHAATILRNLVTVGGASASFHGTTTLQEAIERILDDSAARFGLVRLTISGAVSGTNSHGSATLVHETGHERRRVFYVPREAVSRLQPGADGDFDFELRHSPLSRELTFNRRFFERVIKGSFHPTVRAESDASEYDSEEARQARFQRLGVRPDSRFLNVGVENQVTWPLGETVVQFGSYRLVLMPKTEDCIPSIHVDLSANRLTNRDALTVINRFLSIMTWCDDQFAIAQDGWSGSPVPVAVHRRDLAFTTALGWAFNRQIPKNESTRRALAIYREARNAQQNHMISYAVLNYYKVVEIGHKGRGDAINWYRDNFEAVRQQDTSHDDFERFAKLCGSEKPHEYIYRALRVAVAHANKDSNSDPDDAGELTRLHAAADVLRAFARHFIASRFGVSDVMFGDN
jgi:methylamine utilization protein MauJ